MKPITGALAGAAMAGIATFAVGPRTAAFETSSVTPPAAMHFVTPSVASAPARVEPVRRTQPARKDQKSSNVREERRDERDARSWEKSALIIGGAAASGAGVGGAVDGKKGALIGAAIGGGAASIYEATQRR